MVHVRGGHTGVIIITTPQKILSIVLGAGQLQLLILAGFHSISYNKKNYKLNFSIHYATLREIQTYWQVYFFVYFKGSVSGVPQCPP